MSWDTLIQEKLLNPGIVESVALLNTQGECISSFGNIAKAHFDSAPLSSNLLFLDLFVPRLSEEEITPWWEQKGIEIGQIQFRIFEKTMKSVYGISHRKREGIIINNLPFGVLVSIYTRPHTAQTVVPKVEKFCDLLRA
eukprot:Phypoly_transcript_23361.p1 GENE.Phypoly_transcript_23361~~Phypoly_transcript_23361.p1  ORF type:complete len:139 (+),score=23.56 Phypoly_transcript_23361:79-495(+)